MITKNPMQLKAFIKNKAAEKHITAQLVMQNYMLERLEAAEIIEEVRVAIKDWRKTAIELQIPIKLLGAYSMRWDEL